MSAGYRSGTATGMLTDGLGLLGGTPTRPWGAHVDELLLGFGRHPHRRVDCGGRLGSHQGADAGADLGSNREGHPRTMQRRHHR